MSVDLTPGDVQRTDRIRRAALLAGAALLLLWAVLGAVQLLQVRGVDVRAERRDAVAGRVALLEAQVGSLAVFQDMASDAAAGNAVLAYAMANEVSWAQLLLDLSRGVPETASFTRISGRVVDPLPGTVDPQGVFVLTDQPDVGFFTIEGYTTEIFTPGLQDLLRRFGAIDGFFQEYLSTAAVGDVEGVPVTTFDAEVRMDARARTGRYADGLPEPGGIDR